RILPALLRDHQLELGVEVEDVQAVEAPCQVGLDRVENFRRELVVEIALELTQRLVTISHLVPACLEVLGTMVPTKRRRLEVLPQSCRAVRRTPTTPFASPFFPCAAGTSRCRWGSPGSRPSRDRRSPPRRRAAQAAESSRGGP